MPAKNFWFGLALAAFGLSACNQADKSPVQVDPHAGKGSARIALPTLPAGYLAAPGQQAWFALTISGPGMAPMTRSWIVGPEPPPPLEVDSIPVGLRSFHGCLIRIDSSGRDTSVTHEGADSAWIQRDSVAEVHLFLRQLGSLGSAHVCVEVEGWPSDSSCVPQPPPPFPGSISGCYALVVSKPGPQPGRDSLFKASLSLLQTDSSVFATVTWSPGHSDSATGVYSRSGLFLGSGSLSDFSFQAQRDSIGRLSGYFYDSLRFIMGNAVATPGSCLPETTMVPPPPPPPPAQRFCYAFTQAQSDGKTVKGRVGFEVHADYANTYTHWDGYGAAAGVTSDLMGSLDSSGFAAWSFPPPAGMFSKSLKVDSADYEVKFEGGKAQGKIMKLNSPTRSLGAWTGAGIGCLDSDFRL